MQEHHKTFVEQLEAHHNLTVVSIPVSWDEKELYMKASLAVPEFHTTALEQTELWVSCFDCRRRRLQCRLSELEQQHLRHQRWQQLQPRVGSTLLRGPRTVPVIESHQLEH